MSGLRICFYQRLDRSYARFVEHYHGAAIGANQTMRQALVSE
jgi:hypothetical protein